MVLFLRVYSSGDMAEYAVNIRKGPVKPLKIRPSATKPIDIVLRGSAVTRFVAPACWDLPVLPVSSRRHLISTLPVV
jgi:hypothetical protein